METSLGNFLLITGPTCECKRCPTGKTAALQLETFRLTCQGALLSSLFTVDTGTGQQRQRPIKDVANVRLHDVEPSDIRRRRSAFTGARPTSMSPLTMDRLKGRLDYSRRITLSSEDLTGTIPTEIGSLVEVDYLNLAQNGLSGTIPSYARARAKPSAGDPLGALRAEQPSFF